MPEQVEPVSKEWLSRALADGRGFWQRLPRIMRVGMILTLVVAIAGGAMLAVMDRTEMQVLFSGLSAQDASSIVTQLKAKRVPYRLEGEGNAILVPAEQVHELRLELAGAGLPSGGGVGFELFDQQRFGMTEFEERVAFTRALEGELARTIGRLEVVRGSRVHLVLAKRSMLGAQSSPAQASVVVELKQGRELSEGAIRSVVHLVASSVEGLSPDQITVVDTRGRLLSSSGGEYEAGDSGMDFKKRFERETEARVHEMLGKIVGPDATVVRVAADFDFSKRESTEEHFDPERSVLRSEQRETETTGSTSRGAEGTPGARSNLPGGIPPVASAEGASTKRETETRNYEVDKVVSHIVQPGALLTRLSVAVLVGGTNKEGTPFVPRSSEELRKIETAVRGAIGFDAKRGDTINVQSVPFKAPEVVEPVPIPGPPVLQRWLPVGVGVAVAAAILLALLALRRRAEAQSIPAEMLPLPRNVRELEMLMQQPRALALAGGQNGNANPGSPNALVGEVRQAFMDESESASRVLKAWLREARKPEQKPGE
ncbi:MAG: flagellar basal-body MS-ring/collar protein FliF [Deltaproteobacteria bacterium]|nr:flagellar basal-body MS-ring/collar protein FliF [Deltaproteobacteria bacterium]